MAEEIKTREDLYKVVWSKPMLKLAEEYGISGRGLAKLCERLAVPVPPRGYWRKVSLGQRIKKTPLPKTEFTRHALWKNELSLQDLETRRKGEQERIEIFENPEIEIKDEAIRDIAINTFHEEQKRIPMAILNEQEITNPMVKKFIQLHKSGKNTMPFHLHRGSLAIAVSDTCALRAGILIATILQGFKDRKWEYVIEGGEESYNASMYVCLFQQQVHFSISESVVKKVIPLTEKETEEYRKKFKFGRVPKNKYINTATGRLKFTIKNGYSISQSWEDRNKHLIEDLIKEIMLGFITVAIEGSNEKFLALEREQKLKQEQARKAEEERLKRLEAQRFDQLIKDSESYIRMQQIREYVEFVKNQSQVKAADSDSDIAKWIEWAESKIDKLNPLKEGFPKYLIDSD
jgi:hypothetical protein